MAAHVIDDYQVLGRYRVIVLDRDACSSPHIQYRINGQNYEPVPLHDRPATG